MTRRLGLFLLAWLVVGTARPLAHHAIGAIYDDRRMVTITGEVVRVLLRNPHSFVEVVVRDQKTARIRYSIEWSASDRLGGAGVTGNTLKPGDRVVITGQPARDSNERLLMTMIRRPNDGFVWTSRRDSMNLRRPLR